MNPARLFITLSLPLLAHTTWAQSEWREYPSIERGWYRDPDIEFGYQEPG